MDAREAPPPNLLEQGVVINVAADNSCLDIQEGSVRKASFFKWRPKRGRNVAVKLLNSAPYVKLQLRWRPGDGGAASGRSLSSGTGSNKNGASVAWRMLGQGDGFPVRWHPALCHLGEMEGQPAQYSVPATPDLLARIPQNCFDGEAHQSEQFSSTACVVESLGVHSDTHSDTSASSNDDDIDEDLLDSDWDNIPPVANLESDSHYEREDWDKEINESEACPYDTGDTVESISQQTGRYTPYFGQENTAYDPSCHHALPVTFSLPVRHYQRGQFDDADD